MKNMLWLLTVFISCCVWLIACHKEFTADTCLQAHNELRNLHMDTNKFAYSKELEKKAQSYVDRLKYRDDSIDVRPTHVLPKRRKRHVNGDRIPNQHVENWNGEIYYPSGSWDRNKDQKVLIGENIHKFCCYSQPHCPKEFFHNLLFPPSASGVVKDWYNEEIGSYDFLTGKKKTTYSQIKHFTSIVWKSTKSIGCAQSTVSQQGCVYTIVLYEAEGSTGTAETFKQNVGKLKTEEKTPSGTIVTVVVVVVIIVLICACIIFCYCCRDNLQDKYLEIKIKTDTMKAEQELETDSTNFWWLKIFRTKKPKRRRKTVSRPKNMSLKEKPTIEVVLNSDLQRMQRPSLPRVRGNSNASRYASKYQGINQKPESMLVRDNLGYQKQLPAAPNQFSTTVLGRQPSLSGKPPPPPAPTSQSHHPVSRVPSNSVTPPPRPPAAKLPSNPLNKPPARPLKSPQTAVPPKIPMTPNKPNPKPVIRPISLPINQAGKPKPVPRKNTVPIEEGEKSPSVHELRSALENKPLPPVKIKPLKLPANRPLNR